MATSSITYTSYVSGTLTGSTFTPQTHFQTPAVTISDTGTGFQLGDNVTLSGGITTTGIYEGYAFVSGTYYILIKATTNVLYLFGPPAIGQTYQIDTTDVLACYVEGTQIASETGDRAIESLAVGDRVWTDRGVLRPIVWIGKTRIRPDLHRRPAEVYPVRVVAGAFGPGLPARDLLLSPEHAVFVDEILIPIRSLINGTTVRQEETDDVIYWHLELEDHDVVLAEGLPAETYLDTGNRWCFEDGSAREAALAPPDAGDAIPAVRSCAPVVEDGPVVDRVLHRLGAIAEELGVDAKQEVSIWVQTPGRHVITVPPGDSHVRVRSGMKRVGGDRRRLGAAISAISLGDDVLDLRSRMLGRGFYPTEHDDGRSWCWTNGDAEMVLAASCEPRRLTLDVIGLA